MSEEKTELLKIVRETQLKFLGHFVKEGGLEYHTLTGIIEGTRERGRQKDKKK